MFRKVDCLRLHVQDVPRAVAFYSDRLGHPLVWRDGDREAGLRMADSNSELVLVAGDEAPESDLLVDSVDEAARRFEAAGGSIVERPFDIRIGRCAVVQDPWGNRLVLLDMTKGRLKTDEERNVVGIEPVR